MTSLIGNQLINQETITKILDNLAKKIKRSKEMKLEFNAIALDIFEYAPEDFFSYKSLDKNNEYVKYISKQYKKHWPFIIYKTKKKITKILKNHNITNQNIIIDDNEINNYLYALEEIKQVLKSKIVSFESLFWQKEVDDYNNTNIKLDYLLTLAHKDYILYLCYYYKLQLTRILRNKVNDIGLESFINKKDRKYNIQNIYNESNTALNDYYNIFDYIDSLLKAIEDNNKLNTMEDIYLDDKIIKMLSIINSINVIGQIELNINIDQAIRSATYKDLFNLQKIEAKTENNLSQSIAKEIEQYFNKELDKFKPSHHSKEDKDKLSNIQIEQVAQLIYKRLSAQHPAISTITKEDLIRRYMSIATQLDSIQRNINRSYKPISEEYEKLIQIKKARLNSKQVKLLIFVLLVLSISLSILIICYLHQDPSEYSNIN
ncbi:hypothetical protein NEOKW01_0306 [Nematocida sp. AWRm80]|nr:hypothetical protein NEOKW01_0306 [Nematocida sp. AWRm80]